MRDKISAMNLYSVFALHISVYYFDWNTMFYKVSPSRNNKYSTKPITAFLLSAGNVDLSLNLCTCITKCGEN